MNKFPTYADYEKEAEVYYEWANWVFGLSTFLFAITALQFKSPWRIAALGLIVIVPMFLSVPRRQPPLRMKLRMQAINGDKKINQLLDRVETNLYGLRAAFRHPLVLSSVALYLIVLFSWAPIFSGLVAWFQA
jgi:hypothetical protein